MTKNISYLNLQTKKKFLKNAKKEKIVSKISRTNEIYESFNRKF